MAKAKIGLEMKLYRNTGTYGEPVWAEVKNVVDLKFDPGTADEAEVTIRGTGGWKQFEQGLKAAAYEWGMRYIPGDADLTAIFAAWQAATMIEFAFADGDIETAGTKYWRHECKVFGVPRDEPIGDSVALTVTAKPCTSTNLPTLETVSA